jgi:hypothetical protein
MKLLMAAMLLIYSYFQLIHWRRTKSMAKYVNTEEVAENSETKNTEEVSSEANDKPTGEEVNAE